MAIVYGTQPFPFDSNLISCLDAKNSKCTGTTAQDLKLNTTWTKEGTVTVGTESNVTCFDMNAGNFICTSDKTLGVTSTMFYVLKWRESDTGWRTLYRGSDDHWTIVQDGTKNLGMYSNRDGGFRSSGYTINIAWQTLIVVDVSPTTTSAGSQTLYVNGTQVGTTDRSAAGTSFLRLGYSGQYPGYIAIAGVYDIALSSTQVTTLHNLLNKRIV